MRRSRRLGRALRAALLAAACALWPAPARAGQSGPPPPVSSMLDGAVTYTLPAGWHIAMWMNRSTQGAAQIHDTGDAKTRAVGALFLSAYVIPEGKTAADMIAGNFGNSLRKEYGGTMLSDKSDGEGWRTVVWTQVQPKYGKPELMLEHFGVVNRKFVDVTMSVTLSTDGGDVGRMKKSVADFNAVCESLKIDGRGKFENKVSPDIITKQLKVNTRK